MIGFELELHLLRTLFSICCYMRNKPLKTQAKLCISIHFVASNKSHNSEWLKGKGHLLFYITRCPVVRRVMRLVDFATKWYNKWPRFLPSSTLSNHSFILRLFPFMIIVWLLVSDRNMCFPVHIQWKIDH